MHWKGIELTTIVGIGNNYIDRWKSQCNTIGITKVPENYFIYIYVFITTSDSTPGRLVVPKSIVCSVLSASTLPFEHKLLEIFIFEMYSS